VSSNERTYTDQQNITFHIPKVRLKCDWINQATS